MFSPKDVYRLDPPHNLRASDWVIDLPCPEPRLEGSLGSTRQQHRSVRIQQLVEYVDNRFYKGRFFYKFLTENRGKDPSSGQHVVTGIFAYHEIEHWPGAYSHLQWTKFLMENIEYDALAEARGSEEGLICESFIIMLVTKSVLTVRCVSTHTSNGGPAHSYRSQTNRGKEASDNVSEDGQIDQGAYSL